MPVHYKPTQWRGKRLVYQSLDPDEPKREIRKFIVFVVTGIGMVALYYLLASY